MRLPYIFVPYYKHSTYIFMADIIYDGKASSYAHLTEQMYDFELGNYVSRGWEIFKANAGLMIGFVVVKGILSLACSLIPFLGTFVNLAVLGCMMGGFYLTCQKISNGENVEFGDFFKGFDHIKELFLGQFVMGIMVAIGFICLVLPSIYLAIAYGFMIPLIVLGRMPFWDAMETSRKIITKNWFMFFVMVFVYFGIILLGALALGIGVFVAFPVILCIQYAMYEGIVGINNDLYQEQIDEIGTNNSMWDGDTTMMK